MENYANTKYRFFQDKLFYLQSNYIDINKNFNTDIKSIKFAVVNEKIRVKILIKDSKCEIEFDKNTKTDIIYEEIVTILSENCIYLKMDNFISNETVKSKYFNRIEDLKITIDKLKLSNYINILIIISLSIYSFLI